MDGKNLYFYGQLDGDGSKWLDAPACGLFNTVNGITGAPQ